MLAAPAPLAVGESREDRARRIHAGHQVGGGDTHLLRAAARQVVALAGDAHDAAHGLRDQVVAGAGRIGPRLAEARDRAIDEARIERRERGIVETVLGEAAHLVVFDKDIGAFSEPPGHRLALGRGKIEGDRAFPPIGRHVVGPRRWSPRRPHRAGRAAPQPRVSSARARALDLDHVGAEVGQQLGRPRAGEDAAEIEHLEAGERAGPGRVHGGLPGHCSGRCRRETSARAPAGRPRAASGTLLTVGS